MLKIINRLSPFFEDCYREFGVREYAKNIAVTPPTASKILKGLAAEGLLTSRYERSYLLFRADRNSTHLRDLSKIYWKTKLEDLVKKLNESFNNPKIILFGSLTKLEARSDSDADIAIISSLTGDFNAKHFEKKLGRAIQIFNFASEAKIPKNLKENVLKGIILSGEI